MAVTMVPPVTETSPPRQRAAGRHDLRWRSHRAGRWGGFPGRPGTRRIMARQEAGPSRRRRGRTPKTAKTASPMNPRPPCHSGTAGHPRRPRRLDDHAPHRARSRTRVIDDVGEEGGRGSVDA
jgi:hypothetical protein